jgi:hypothetical protein
VSLSVYIRVLIIKPKSLKIYKIILFFSHIQRKHNVIIKYDFLQVDE